MTNEDTNYTTVEENYRYGSAEPKLQNSMKIKFRKIKSITDRNQANCQSMREKEVIKNLVDDKSKLYASQVKVKSRTARLA